MMRYRSFGGAGRVLLSVIGLGGSGYGQERIMRVSAVRRQERYTPTHLIKNCTSL